MYRALLLKELKETWWLGAVAFALLGVQLWSAVGLNADFETFSISWRSGNMRRIPFLQSDFGQVAAMTACALGVLVAVFQTFGESVRGTWSFLLHRPIDRRTIILMKLGTGLALTLGSTAVPILLYAWWAATPGMHASPFSWWMTRETWMLWLVSIPLYLGTFLCGIRAARWYGTRFLPLVAVGCLPLLIEEYLRATGPLLALIAFAAAILLPSILESADNRDYA